MTFWRGLTRRLATVLSTPVAGLCIGLLAVLSVVWHQHWADDVFNVVLPVFGALLLAASTTKVGRARLWHLRQTRQEAAGTSRESAGSKPF